MFANIISGVSILCGCVGCFFLGTIFENKLIKDYMEKKYQEERVNKVINKIMGRNKIVEDLKNALLSYALNTLNESKCKLNLNYQEFDGTELPMLSGYDIKNACFTYIQDKDTIPYMRYKQEAIQKYLNKNFCTKEQAEEFFMKFVKTHNEINL